MTEAELNALKKSILSWAKPRPDISGILLVGSCARGDFRPDSDVDLVILSENPGRLLDDRSWTGNFGKIQSQGRENWGAVASLRTKYEDGLEFEFGITGLQWAGLDPIDKGTLQVVRNGARIIWDPGGILDTFLTGCSNAIRKDPN